MRKRRTLEKSRGSEREREREKERDTHTHRDRNASWGEVLGQKRRSLCRNVKQECVTVRQWVTTMIRGIEYTVLQGTESHKGAK